MNAPLSSLSRIHAPSADDMQPLPASVRARIIAVTSGKGGVGKTFLCANLAAALTRQGLHVLVLDADLGLANMDVALNLYPPVTLHEVFSAGARLEDAIVTAPGDFDVLLVGSGMADYSRLTPEMRSQFVRVLKTLAPSYDVVLLDTGAGLSDVVLFAVSLAAEVLIVATPEPTSLADAYAAIKVLCTQQKRHTLRLAVNQTVRPGDGRAITGQLQQVLNRFVNIELGHPMRLIHMGDIPVDKTVREAIMRRQLLLQTVPGSPASLAVAQLASRVRSAMLAQPAAQPVAVR